jgi:hypothetical protein
MMRRTGLYGEALLLLMVDASDAGALIHSSRKNEAFRISRTQRGLFSAFGNAIKKVSLFRPMNAHYLVGTSQEKKIKKFIVNNKCKRAKCILQIQIIFFKRNGYFSKVHLPHLRLPNRRDLRRRTFLE